LQVDQSVSLSMLEAPMGIFMRFAFHFLAVVLLAWHGGPSLGAQQSGAPTKITHVDPVYPEQARQARVQGIVMVQITIGTDGRVSSARVIRSIPLLDQAALDAVRQWVYDAATIKAPVILTVTVPFGIAAPSTTIAPRPTQPAASPPTLSSVNGTTASVVPCESKTATPGEILSSGLAYFRKNDTGSALACYREAAERGNASAMCDIANMYSSGQGVEKNDSLAFEWSLKCAEAGSAHGMYRVSIAYDTELNLYPALPKDARLAFSWALKAANLGHVVAMRNLARMYGTGQGTKQDDAEANRWMQMSYKETKDPLGAPGNQGT
jgi:protein TonB